MAALHPPQSAADLLPAPPSAVPGAGQWQGTSEAQGGDRDRQGRGRLGQPGQHQARQAQAGQGHKQGGQGQAERGQGRDSKAGRAETGTGEDEEGTGFCPCILGRGWCPGPAVPTETPLCPQAAEGREGCPQPLGTAERPVPPRAAVPSCRGVKAAPLGPPRAGSEEGPPEGPPEVPPRVPPAPGLRGRRPLTPARS